MYTYPQSSPEYLVQGLGQEVSFTVYKDGTQQVPSSVYYSLSDSSGTAIVASTGCAIDGSGTATTTVPGAVTAAEDLGESWTEQWEATLAGDVYYFRRPVILVLRELYPTVLDQDLQDLHADITNHYPSGQSSWADQIEAAWDHILTLLLEAGVRANLVMNPYAFKRVHVYKSLEIIFRLVSTYSSGSSKYKDLADYYAAEFKSAWRELNLVVDAGEDGVADDGANIQMPGVIWLKSIK